MLSECFHISSLLPLFYLLKALAHPATPDRPTNKSQHGRVNATDPNTDWSYWAVNCYVGAGRVNVHVALVAKHVHLPRGRRL